MKSILEDIYYGRRGHTETIEESKAYWEVNEKYSEIYGKLLEGLNDEQKKLLDELFLQSAGLEEEAGLTRFKEGFNLGLLMGFEVLSEKP